MGNLHIVTGYKGQNHVTAADTGSFQAAIFGTGQYVLNRGSKFQTTTVSNNLIRVANGDLLIQGRHVRLNEGTHVDLPIDNGQQGYLRNDLIVARYTKDSVSGVEDVNLVVIKGTPAASSPVDPSYTAGNIIEDHVYLADMPLYRVPLNGLNVGTLVKLYTDASVFVSPARIGAIPDSEKGTANGVATLDSDRKVTPSQSCSKIIVFNESGTIALSHSGACLQVNSASDVTITVQGDGTVLIPVGTEIEIVRWGSGAVTIAAETGVYIRSADDCKTIASRYGAVALKKMGGNTWLLAGCLG